MLAVIGEVIAFGVCLVEEFDVDDVMRVLVCDLDNTHHVVRWYRTLVREREKGRLEVYPNIAACSHMELLPAGKQVETWLCSLSVQCHESNFFTENLKELLTHLLHTTTLPKSLHCTLSLAPPNIINNPIVLAIHIIILVHKVIRYSSYIFIVDWSSRCSNDWAGETVLDGIPPDIDSTIVVSPDQCVLRRRERELRDCGIGRDGGALIEGRLGDAETR